MTSLRRDHSITAELPISGRAEAAAPANCPAFWPLIIAPRTARTLVVLTAAMLTVLGAYFTLQRPTHITKPALYPRLLAQFPANIISDLPPSIPADATSVSLHCDSIGLTPTHTTFRVAFTVTPDRAAALLADAAAKTPGPVCPQSPTENVHVFDVRDDAWVSNYRIDVASGRVMIEVINN